MCWCACARHCHQSICTCIHIRTALTGTRILSAFERRHQRRRKKKQANEENKLIFSCKYNKYLNVYIEFVVIVVALFDVCGAAVRLHHRRWERRNLFNILSAIEQWEWMRCRVVACRCRGGNTFLIPIASMYLFIVKKYRHQVLCALCAGGAHSTYP